MSWRVWLNCVKYSLMRSVDTGESLGERGVRHCRATGIIVKEAGSDRQGHSWEANEASFQLRPIGKHLVDGPSHGHEGKNRRNRHPCPFERQLAKADAGVDDQIPAYFDGFLLRGTVRLFHWRVPLHASSSCLL